MELIPENLIPNTYEYLKEGISPIIVCISNDEQHGLKKEVPDSQPDPTEEDLAIVNFYDSKESLDSKGILNGGTMTYMISPVDSRPKITTDLGDCTSLIAVGTDKVTRKNISLLTHQSTSQFLEGKEDDFINQLTSRLQELKDLSEDHTVDVVVAGGDTNSDEVEEYNKSVELLSVSVLKVFGFTPLIIAGPKGPVGSENVLFDTEKRRLYVARPKDPSGRVSYGDFRLKPEKFPKE